MSFFDNDERMYVPLSIDTVEAEKSNYFFSNTKMIYAVVAMLPLFFLLYPLIDGGISIIPILIVFAVYLFLYSYFFRFVIFEEKRLRRMVRELDANRISGVDHFWGIDKIGGGEKDDGMIYYAYKGSAKGTTRGLIVKFDRGSVVGVPEGHYRNFRVSKQQFMRKLYASGFDFEWYEVQKQPEIQESLIEYADMLSSIPNEYHKKLMKLQLNIQDVYTKNASQRYEDYVVIKRPKFTSDFKVLLNDIIEESLKKNGYIVNPYIIGKKEVEKFFRNHLLIESLDSESIRKSVDVEPFENFAKVHRLIDAEGREVAIQYLDNLDINTYRGPGIDNKLQMEQRKKERQEEVRKKNYQLEKEKLNRKRNRDALSHGEYLEELKALNEKYDPETYNPNAEKEAILKRREEEKLQKEKERKEKRNKTKEIKEIEIKEYDLDEKDQKSDALGDESLDKILQNKFKRMKHESIKKQEKDQEINQKTSNESVSLDELLRRKKDN